MPRCPACGTVATWRLVTYGTPLCCRACGAALRRVREPVAWSVLIGIAGGCIMGLGLYLGVEFEQRFILTWSFLAASLLAYLFLWSQLRVQSDRSRSQRAL